MEDKFIYCIFCILLCHAGFAVSYGEFTDDQTADIVSGAPRASFLQGQV